MRVSAGLPAQGSLSRPSGHQRFVAVVAILLPAKLHVVVVAVVGVAPGSLESISAAPRFAVVVLVGLVEVALPSFSGSQ